MTLEATIVAKGCLPKVLAVLMNLELVPRGSVDYLQNIQVARSVGLPSALTTLPSGISGDVALWHSLELIHLGKAEVIQFVHYIKPRRK